MVFDGDWNGGERTFRVLPGQSLAFESITRVDPDGTRHPLTAGESVGGRRVQAGRARRAALAQPPAVRSAVRAGRARLRDRLHALRHSREAGRSATCSTTTSPSRPAVRRSGSSTVSLALDPVWKPRARCGTLRVRTLLRRARTSSSGSSSRTRAAASLPAVTSAAQSRRLRPAPGLLARFGSAIVFSLLRAGGAARRRSAASRR